MKLLATSFVAVLALTLPASAQQHLASQALTQNAPARGVPVQRIVSPGGIDAWLVSNSTVPMIVMSAYWRGG